MSAPSLSNVFSDVYISGNCTVKGTLSSLAGSITSQWTTTGSAIYYTTGNVGIGTNSPSGSGTPGSLLHVADSTANNPTVHVDASIGTGQARLHLRSGTGSTNRASRIDFFNNVTSSTVPQWTVISGYDQNGTNDLRYVNYTGAITMAWAQNGNIGIGTTNPGSLLTVSGGGSFGSGYQAFTAPTGGLIVQGNVGIGTSNPGVNALQVSGNVVTQGFTSNATNTIFNFDTLTLPFVVATQIASTSTAPLQITSNVDLGTGTMTVATVISSTGLMFRNRIINGDFRLDQRNAGVSFTVSAGAAKTYTLDRWWGWCAVGSKFSVQRSTDVPVGQGFTNSVLVTSLSAYSTPVGGYYGFGQYIEGYNIADMGFGTASATTVTLSFWARSSIAGTFSVALENGSFNRSYIFNYTISSVNTWQYFTLPFRADTTGTWDNTTGQGLRIWWDLGSSDTTYANTAGSWLAADALRTTGAVSLIGTNAATLYIAGAQLEKGSAATPFEFRPYPIELQLCQRYYYQIQPTSPFGIIGPGVSTSTTSAELFINYPLTLRSNAVTLNTSTAASFQWYVPSVHTPTVATIALPSAPAGEGQGFQTVRVTITWTTAGGAGAQPGVLRCISGAQNTTYFGFSCEL